MEKYFYRPGDHHISILGMKFLLSSHEEYQEIAGGGQTFGQVAISAPWGRRGLKFSQKFHHR